MFQLRQEIIGAVDRNGADIGPGDHRTINVNGIAGAGDCDDVATIKRGQAEMGNALLGAYGDDGLGQRVELHVIAFLVPIANRLAQTRDSLGQRVAMGRRLSRRFNHLVDDVLGRGPGQGCPCRSR